MNSDVQAEGERDGPEPACIVEEDHAEEREAGK